eukprot:gnl/Spiro4/3848_TR1896_c0_g1_i1.p1 gnl/Spiro4/3848_TR1896_c0_g1~~gnl/Spiro4/3848_TR1896_c0_g1_i1.p1  ORF type:complete len:112 (+),score=17.43 gnl/Spiro4/3848_TR1896_c0_g1_i1:73-408(+)
MDDDPMWAELEALAQQNDHCGVSSCRENVKLMPQTCPCCKRVFCLGHADPFRHGCGDDFRRMARAEFVASTKLPLEKPPKVKPERKAALKFQLGKKIKTLQTASGRSRAKK